MSPENGDSSQPICTGCCPCGHSPRSTQRGATRREFLADAGGLGLIGTALTGLSWSAVT